MTVQIQIPNQNFIANGTNSSFTLDFAVEDKNNIVVLIDNVIVNPISYSYNITTNAVVFNIAPASGSQITIKRKTTLERTINYQTYDNSLRPEIVNYDVDRVWRFLQEQNWGLDQEILNRIQADIDYDKISQIRDDELKAYVDSLYSSLTGVSPILGFSDQFVEVQQPFTATVVRTQHDKNTEFVSVKDFGAVGDGITNDTIAIQRAANWFKTGSNRRLVFPAGGVYYITAPITFNSSGSEYNSLIMHSPIRPEPGLGRAFLITGYRNSEFVLKVDGGGQDADYMQADPIGGDNAFTIAGCRHCKLDVIGSDYAGRVLNVRAGTSPYKTSFLDISLDCGDRTDVIGASRCGQAVFCLGPTTAFGGFRYLNAAWCKYSPVFLNIVDCVIHHAEGGTANSFTSWTWDNCGSIWLGKVLLGDETSVETLMTFKNGCRRIHIENYFAVIGAIGLLVEDTVTSAPSLSIGTIHGTGNGILLKLHNVHGAKVDSINSASDGNALVISGNSQDIDAYVTGYNNKKETVIISDTASIVTIRGISRNASQELGEAYAAVKVTSTEAGIVFDGFTIIGASPSAAFSLQANNNVKILNGRYETSPDFLGGVEPLQVSNAQGIMSKAMGTALIPSGTTSVTIPHELFNTPSHVLVTGRSAETKDVYVAVIDNTNIRFEVPVAVTTDSTVFWFATRKAYST